MIKIILDQDQSIVLVPTPPAHPRAPSGGILKAERGAAPAGSRNAALGRPRGSSRRSLGTSRQGLADCDALSLDERVAREQKNAAGGAPRGARFESQGSAARRPDGLAPRLRRAERLRQPLAGLRTPRRLAGAPLLSLWRAR